MPELQAILLCDLILQTPDGKLQLQGLFDVINTPSLPAQHQRMWLYFRFLLDEAMSGSERTLRFFLRRPTGQHDTLPELKIRVGDQGTVQGHIQLQGLPLREPGVHWLDVDCDQERVGSCRFFVRLSSGQVAEPAQPGVTIH